LSEVEAAGTAGQVGYDQRTEHGCADAIQELGGNDEYRIGGQRQHAPQTLIRRSSFCTERLPRDGHLCDM
jgi:hypothetical protein